MSFLQRAAIFPLLVRQASCCPDTSSSMHLTIDYPLLCLQTSHRVNFKKSSHRTYISHKGCQQFHHTVTVSIQGLAIMQTHFSKLLSQPLQRQDTFPPSTNSLLSTVSQQLASCLPLKPSTIKTCQNGGTSVVVW